MYLATATSFSMEIRKFNLSIGKAQTVEQKEQQIESIKRRNRVVLRKLRQGEIDSQSS